jgi:anthranilate phosphoribosyltransferase
MPEMAATVYDLRSALDKLIQGQSISGEEAFEIADNIAKGHVDATQLAALLALLASKQESPDIIAGFARGMRQHAVNVDHTHESVQEIVGTGGDGHDTVNISTAAAILASSCGVIVAKHGSVSVSSRSGAADVLRALGVSMLGPRGVCSSLADCGLAFMFAPLFHPAMAKVVPVRKALKVRTLFNILGPLLNPARAHYCVLGVYSPHLLPIYADTIAQLGVQHALVVHCCGMDEITPVGPTSVIEVRAGQAHVASTIDPLSWGVPRCSIDDLKGGGPVDNAGIVRRVLAGGEEADKPIGLTIALNAGAALYTFSSAPWPHATLCPCPWPRVSSVEEGFRVAQAALREGKGLAKLTMWAETTQRLAAEEQGS